MDHLEEYMKINNCAFPRIGRPGTLCQNAFETFIARAYDVGTPKTRLSSGTARNAASEAGATEAATTSEQISARGWARKVHSVPRGASWLRGLSSLSQTGDDEDRGGSVIG